MTKSNAERRQYPRINQTLPIKVQANGYRFTTNTENVSCVGAYFHLDKYIPPFTKIAVKLVLPVKSGSSVKSINVDCNGVVVRSDDEKNGGFNMAVFFNEIKESQRKRISQYINQFLPKSS
jgi:c-di-GMP-binding flagellar brake protein YcgR